MNDGFGARFKALITRPRDLGAMVKERPNWLAPALVILGVMWLFTGAVTHIAGPEQLELMRDSKLMKMMPEEQWQAQYRDALAPSLLKRVGDGAAGGLGTCVAAIILASVLNLFAKLSGGKGRYKQMLALVLWTGLIPFVFGSVLKFALVMVKESVVGVSVGLAALLPDPDYTSFLHQFLTTFGDFTMWWALAVLVIGVEVVYELRRGTAVTVVLLPWALLSGVALIVGRLFM
jgi:hypothetical protein